MKYIFRKDKTVTPSESVDGKQYYYKNFLIMDVVQLAHG